MAAEMLSKNRMMVFKYKGKDQEVSIRCVHHCAQLRCASGNFGCRTDWINQRLLWVLVFFFQISAMYLHTLLSHIMDGSVYSVSIRCINIVNITLSNTAVSYFE